MIVYRLSIVPGSLCQLYMATGGNRTRDHLDQDSASWLGQYLSMCLIARAWLRSSIFSGLPRHLPYKLSTLCITCCEDRIPSLNLRQLPKRERNQDHHSSLFVAVMNKCQCSRCEAWHFSREHFCLIRRSHFGSSHFGSRLKGRGGAGAAIMGCASIPLR